MKIDTYKKRAKHSISESTLKSRVSALNNLDSFVGGKEVTVSDVEDWVDHLISQHDSGDIKASTIRQYVKAVDYYFNTVKGERNALEHIKNYLPEKDVDHGDYLDNEQWDHLLDSTESLRDECILRLMYHYARRPREVILLNREDISFSDEDGPDRITFNILKKQKGDLDTMTAWMGSSSQREMKVLRASFEMVPEVETKLKQYMRFSSSVETTIIVNGEEKQVQPVFVGNSGRLTYRSLERIVSRQVENAGFGDMDITPKSMRHTRATHLDWEGYSPGQISRQQLRHGPNSNQIAAYIHPRDEDQVSDVMKTDQEKSTE